MLLGREVNRATSATTRIEGLWAPVLPIMENLN
jgi:hypothetical protein